MVQQKAFTPEEWKKKLSGRLATAKGATASLRTLWLACLQVIYDIPKNQFYDSMGNFKPQIKDSDETNINLIARDIKSIHSTLSSNPPTVMMVRASTRQEDSRKAANADRIARYNERKYAFQEHKDINGLWTLSTGNAVGAVRWDANKGDVLNVDPSGEVVCEGDVSIESISPFKFFPEPGPTQWREVRWAFEECTIVAEEVWNTFTPDQIERLKKACGFTEDATDTTIYRYYQIGEAWNAYTGFSCWCADDGTIIDDDGSGIPAPNPIGPIRNGVRYAKLPYNLWTEIDVLGTYWGIPTVAYSMAVQAKLHQLDNITLDSLAAHGVTRLVLPETSDIADGQITNSPLDIVRIKGNAPPYFMQTMPANMVTTEMRAKLEKGVQDLDGVTENFLGQQSRVQSGHSQEFGASRVESMRHRMFTKYTDYVVWMHSATMELQVEHWTVQRMIRVEGNENAYEMHSLKGTDFDGPEVRAEYGRSFSQDPDTRRKELMMYMPLLEKCGLPLARILSLARFGEIETAEDLVKLGEYRMQEVLDQIVQTNTQVEPQEWEIHGPMIQYATTSYLGTADFRDLSPVQKELIWQHIKLRKQMEASLQPVGAGPPGAAPPGGALAALGSGAPQLDQPPDLSALGG